VSANIFYLNKLNEVVKGVWKKVRDNQLVHFLIADSSPVGNTSSIARGQVFSGYTGKDNSQEKVVNNPFEFDIASLLRLRSFLYLLAGTGFFVFQIHNNLAINNLAKQNEQLREQVQMTSSVIISQELKVHELHSIHNIVQTANTLDLMASCVPPVTIAP